MKSIVTLITIIFCFTVNAQITWTAGSNISTSTYGNMHPRMSLDGSGNPLVVWGRMSDQSVLFSRWDGTMFTTPVKLNPTWLTVATASWMGPDIASHGDTIYVVVKRTPETSDTNRIFIFTSFNGGISFNTPVELAFIADSVSRFPTVTTDATGNPFVAFMKFNSMFKESRWVVTRSNDYGNNFSVDVKASGWGSSAEVCDCCPGALILSNNTCAMLYRDNNNNIRDIWTGMSTNSGNNFTNGFALENNNWMVMSCPSSGPDGFIIDDTIYSTFMSGGSGNYRTYFSKSSISSGMVNEVNNLTGTFPGLSQQNFPRIANSGAAMAIVWKQTVNGAAQLPVLFTSNLANGLPAVYDTVDLDNITNTDVALDNGNIFVVWQDDGSGTVKYRFGTYTPAPTGIIESTENDVSIYPNPVQDILNITSALNKTFYVRIYNSFGELIYTAGESTECILITTNWDSGMYFIQLQSDNKYTIQKLIKL